MLTETPSYLGAIQAFTMYGAEYVSVPMDGDGLRTGVLERALRVGPKFLYVLPNFQNPSGVTLSDASTFGLHRSPWSTPSSPPRQPCASRA